MKINVFFNKTLKKNNTNCILIIYLNKIRFTGESFARRNV